MRNIFLYGGSGSGKDTLADYFQNTHKYLKFRCAGTIKQIICEREKIGGLAALEKLKRTNKKLREAHWKYGDWMGKDHSAVVQRLMNICERTSPEFDILPKSMRDMPIIVSDVRNQIEMRVLLQHGFVGICLARETGEHGIKAGQHITESNMFKNGQLEAIMKEYPNQIIPVMNFTSDQSTEGFWKMSEKFGINSMNMIMFDEAPKGEVLIRAFSNNLLNVIPTFFETRNQPDSAYEQENA